MEVKYNVEGALKENLGLDYSKEGSTFKVFSPPNENLKLRIFDSSRDIIGKTYPMEKDENGIFSTRIEGDLAGKFYSYITDGDLEVTDPYSVGSMINSKKSAIVDLRATDPQGFRDHKKPTTKVGQAIIYELHIKDFTVSENSGVKARGKFLGLGERSTSYMGEKTGLDHLVDLGVTHVHLLPVYDFLTVDEDPDRFYEDSNYNWGYDPKFYNVPEGSYSTDPYDPGTRIFELKKLIMDLHQAGLKVVLDVVYNHTFRGSKSNFQALYPNYYYRTLEKDCLSNGSGCGNEIKTEAPMMRKFILESIRFWMEEYKVDGFRFDLMGLIDLETMEQITKTAKDLDPDVLIYGEPWLAGYSPLAEDQRTLKGTQRSKGFSCFNDSIRDCIKGDPRGYGLGFVMGDYSKKICVETGLAGEVNLDDNHQGFTDEPWESINYLNCHDDLILWDKIDLVLKDWKFEEKKDAYKLANSLIFFSFGLPFIHEGNEFLRTKDGRPNTYNSPRSINQVDWELKVKNKDVFLYFKDLIALRKEIQAFSTFTAEDLRQKLVFLDLKYRPVISYVFEDGEYFYLFAHNGSRREENLSLEKVLASINKKFDLDLDSTKISLKKLFSKTGRTNRDLDLRAYIKINPLESQVIRIEKRCD